MADENDENNEEYEREMHVFGGPLSDLPDGIRQMLESKIRQDEQRELDSEVTQHDWYSWVREMTEEQLKILYRFINVVSGSPEAAGYHLGYINRIMEEKFNLCPGCHKNHDEALNNIVSGDT